jgi:hypothetical protein
MFGRRKRDADVDAIDGEVLEVIGDEDDDLGGESDADPDAVDEGADDEARTGGPWDSGDADRPTEAPHGWGELDLGSMVITVPVEAEVRMDIDEQTQAVNAVAILYADSVMQVMPYAGPRSSGIWPDVRSEIAGNITSSGGTVEERKGPMGTELRAVVPAEEGQRLPARFIGVDGPRWFLRAVVTGSGAHDDAAIEPMLEVLQRLVVVRDEQARPLQEPLPVRLPVEGGQPEPEDEDDDDTPDLNPFERGPEITEIR